MAEPWTAERQATVFRAAYLDERKVEPSMGGRNVGGFHSRVLGTARAQNADPETLFRKHLATWLKKRVTAKARSAPYAFFDQAWGELADAGPEPVAERVEASAADTKAARAERIAELRAELGVIDGDLAIAHTKPESWAEARRTRRMAVLAELRKLKGDQ